MDSPLVKENRGGEKDSSAKHSMEHREMTPMPVVLVGPLRVTPETITTPVGTSVKQHNTILICAKGVT